MIELLNNDQCWNEKKTLFIIILKEIVVYNREFHAK